MEKQKHFYLIRGLAREAEHWHDFPALLAASFPDSKITTIDIPGAGEYLHLTTPLSVDRMVEVMHQKFSLGYTEGEESVMVAVSLGGMIGCGWLKKYPKDFHRAVFINTSFGDYSPIHHRLKPKALFYLLKVPFLSGRAKEEHILKLVSNNTRRFEETIGLWERINSERPIGNTNAIRQLLAAASFRVGPFSPPVPVYLIASTNDRMVSIHCSRAISKKWQVPLVEHPEGGHDLTTDYPEWVAEKIRDLISI